MGLFRITVVVKGTSVADALSDLLYDESAYDGWKEKVVMLELAEEYKEEE